MRTRYLIALGSNVRHRRYGAPEGVLRAAFEALAEVRGFEVEARSPIGRSDPLGPSLRRYANGEKMINVVDLERGY